MGTDVTDGAKRAKDGNRILARRLSGVAAALLVATSVAGGPAPQPAEAGSGYFVYEDLVYASHDDGHLTLDVYQPADAKRAPVLVLVHGGSWQRGSKGRWRDLAPRFARQGFVVVAANYRLARPAGDATFPEPVDDVLTVVSWARKNAREYGGNPKRVAMLGSSAGAHLALHAAASSRGPDAIALFSPPVDLKALYRRGILVGAIEKFLGCYPEECPTTYSRASGLAAVGSNFPPTMLAYSLKELVPKEQSRTLAKSLKKRAVRTEIVEFPGGNHAMPLVEKLLNETSDFLKAALTKQRIG